MDVVRRYSRFINAAIDFVLSLQITTNADPEAFGGFRAQSNSPMLRVDRNQHAVMALMEAYELGVLTGTRPK